jgi:hypothetical protein
MGNTAKVLLRRRDYEDDLPVYDFVSDVNLSDGDRLWDVNSGVVYDVFDSVAGMVIHADPDPLFTESLLDLEIL